MSSSPSLLLCYLTQTISRGVNKHRAFGAGPLRSTAAELVTMALSDRFWIKSPSQRYKTIRPSHKTFRNITPREVAVTTAGVISLLHILWTGAGPDPISPFLIYAALESRPSNMVNHEFIELLDDDSRSDDFFMALKTVEERWKHQEDSILVPFSDQIITYWNQTVRVLVSLPNVTDPRIGA